jgi:hypothetical protein
MRATHETRANAQQEPGEAHRTRELEGLRVTCWRQAQEISSLRDTVAVLRSGANRLAADNAIMSAELTITQTADQRPQRDRG